MRIQGKAVASICPTCSSLFEISASAFNRARKRDYWPHCSRACSGKARRKNRPAKEKKQHKADYDRARRERLGEALRAQRREAYQRDRQKHLERMSRKRAEIRADPEAHQAHKDQMRKYREAPGWKEHKRKYDREWRARRYYGEFWEAHLALLELEDEISDRTSRTEVYTANGTLNKKLERRREWQKNNHPDGS